MKSHASLMLFLFGFSSLLPLFFSVAPGFEAMKNQNICNCIMVKLIQNCNNIFEVDGDQEGSTEEQPTLIIVKVLLYTHWNTRC